VSNTRIGLIGYCCPTGLGYENRRMWAGLAASWLVWPHELLGVEGIDELVAHDADRSLDLSLVDTEACTSVCVDTFLDGVDVVVCAERPFPDDLFDRARARGVKTVLLVNPEWRLGESWSEADVVIARTSVCHRVVQQVTGRRDVQLIPCPLDVEQLPFTHVLRADWGLYSHGWGGVHDRKGWPTIRALLNVAPTAPIAVRSQRELPDSPVPIYPAVASPADLYRSDGDVSADIAIQPSRFEGVGLAILEAMACGLPVLTTDAAPMNEYVRAAYGDLAHYALLAVERVELVPMWTPWPSHLVEPATVAEAMAKLQAEPDVVAELSMRGRTYVVAHHGQPAWDALQEAVVG